MKKIAVLLFMLFGLFLFGITNEEKLITGVYLYRITDEAQFLISKEYDSFICIVLFEDGRFVKYEKNVNRLNNTDVRYKPINCGFFNLSKELLFLQPNQGLFEIYSVKKEKLIGSYSDFVFLKQKD